MSSYLRVPKPKFRCRLFSQSRSTLRRSLALPREMDFNFGLIFEVNGKLEQKVDLRHKACALFNEMYVRPQRAS